MVLIHSDTPLLVIVLQNHFNIGSRYGFLFLINCSTSFYNEPVVNLKEEKEKGMVTYELIPHQKHRADA
jgi:hypothetical protein